MPPTDISGLETSPGRQTREAQCLWWESGLAQGAMYLLATGVSGAMADGAAFALLCSLLSLTVDPFFCSWERDSRHLIRLTQCSGWERCDLLLFFLSV